MNVGYKTWKNKTGQTTFTIKNITTNKVVRLFNVKVYPQATYDLLSIPYVSEADIKHSLLKGELNTKIQSNEIRIHNTNIDLLQFSEDQKQFLINAGATEAVDPETIGILQDHASTHLEGGGDEITGSLKDAQKISISKNSGPVSSTQNHLNIIEGNYSSITINDDTNKTDITVNVSANTIPHNILTNLNQNNHPQYLLRDGTNAMTSDLDVGSQNIVNVNLVDGITVSQHADRHESGGDDPIDADILHISYTPHSYTPDTDPIQVSSPNHLTAHLAGIDNILNGGAPIVDPVINGNLDMDGYSILNADTINGWDANYHDITEEPSGFPNNTDSVISIDDGIRTFTIQPTTDEFTYYVKGVKFIVSEPQTVLWTDVEGLHFFYYDQYGELSHTTNQTILNGIIGGAGALIALIYWNAEDNVTLLFAEERHRFMPGDTHLYLHNAFGAQWVSGGALNNFNIDGDGSDDNQAQFGAEDVVIRDEDITHSWSDGNPQDISPIVYMPVFYRSGINDAWRKKDSDGYAFIYNGTAGYVGTNIAYNLNNSGIWELTEADDGYYVLSHIFATNDIIEPYLVILGQNQYATLSEARVGANDEMASIIVGGLPTLEFVPLGTIMIQTSSSFTNTVKAIIVSTNEGADYIDLRGNSRAGTLSATHKMTLLHSDLIGNEVGDNHPQYLPLTGSRSMTGNLSLGTNNIISVGLINGIDILDHSSRHENGGADEISIVGLSGKLADIQPYVIFITAPDFDTPNSADWALNSAAALTSDTINTAINVLRFDDTTEEGAGFNLILPSNTTSLSFNIVCRAQTAPGGATTVQWALYARDFPHNAAVNAWSSRTLLNAMNIPTNTNWQYFTQVLTLGELGLTAGRHAQFEISRYGVGVNDSLTGDLVLKAISITVN